MGQAERVVGAGGLDLLPASPSFSVVPFVDFAEMLVGNVGVDLGGGHRRVAEELLNGAKIGSAHE